MKFGTSGLRGLVTDLEGHASALYASAFATHLVTAGFAKPGDRIFVGMDHRPSSPDIAATCIGALQRTGFQAIDCGTIATPALALYAMSKGAACLMVTGSHIPADRNGIKFYRPDGEIDKLDEQAITRIAADISDTLVDLTPGVAKNEHEEAKAAYLARYSEILPEGALGGLKVGVYQHSTVARDTLVDIITHFGAQVLPLGRSSHFIPVDTEAVSPETIALMQGWAAAHGLDAIVSADGDGDRPLVADESGTPLRGDLLGLMTAQFLNAQVVVTPITSNSGIEVAGGFSVSRCKVGSPFVIEAMNAALAAGKAGVMGFEANGGVLTGSDFPIADLTIKALPTRDSVLPILASLLLAASKAKPLSKIAAEYNLPFAAADRLENFSLDTSAALMTYLTARDDNLASFIAPLGGVAGVNQIDGLRVTLDDGRIIHLRPSGNAPEMRCYVEAEDAASAAALLAEGMRLIRDWSVQR